MMKEESAERQHPEALYIVEPGESNEQENAASTGDVQNEIDTLRKEVQNLQDRLLRTAAEYQNYRRRTEQEKAGLVDFGKTLVVQPFLDILDDMERTLDAVGQVDSQNGLQTFREGVELVYRKFREALERLGVEPIEALGQPFHENEHDAVMQQPTSDGAEPGTVIGELQKGYRMGDRILRHSKVIVAA